jgi:hypothetical protein
MASAIRSVSYDLAAHGIGSDPAAKADYIKQALKKAVDAIPEKDLTKVRGGQIIVLQ